MSMMDPFNPRPLPRGDHYRPERGLGSESGGKAFLWVSAAIIGCIGIFAVIASL